MTSATKASGDLVWLGIVLGVFASMTGTIGKQLLRFSELLKQKGLTYNSKVAWTIGILLNTVVGPIVDMTSYAFAPQSLIAPLGGLDVVWNTLSAPFTLGEKLNKTIVFGVVLIAGGATGTSLFGNHDDKDYTVDIITDTFTRWIILVYLSILFVWLAFNILVLQKRSANPKGQPWITGDPIRGLSLGMTAGSISGNMFCVKGFVELVQASIRDEDASIWAHYLPYVLLVGAILFAVTNVFFLDKATREYNALFMGAVFEGSLIVCAAVSGIVVYADLDELEWYQRIGYFSCLFSIVSGVLIVARGSYRDEVEEEVEAVIEKGIMITHSCTPQGVPRSPRGAHKMLSKARGSFLFVLPEDGPADDTKPPTVQADASNDSQLVSDDQKHEVQDTDPEKQCCNHDKEIFVEAETLRLFQEPDREDETFESKPGSTTDPVSVPSHDADNNEIKEVAIEEAAVLPNEKKSGGFLFCSAPCCCSREPLDSNTLVKPM